MKLRPSLCPAILLLSCWLSAAHLDNEQSQSTISPSPSSAPGSIYSRAYTDHKIAARDIAVNPPDGKDGKPHDGPFVETGADRDRKKAISNNREQDSGSDIDEASVEDGKTLPKSNNGVMEDRNGPGPDADTRGMEDGVSSKSRKMAGSQDNIPHQPKEAPLHLKEGEKPQEADPRARVPAAPADRVNSNSGNGPLKKPVDLPDSPHQKGSPKIPSDNTDPLAIHGINSPKELLPAVSVSDEVHSLYMSLTMILFSEVGDKTFLVAALMAMRHTRTVVFSSAFSALFLMTVLSAVLGHAVPTLLPAKLTQFAASALFLIFGMKMFFEARQMSPNDSASDEMKEVELELDEKEGRSRHEKRDSMMESGRSNFGGGLLSPVSPVPASSSRSPSPSTGASLSSFSEGMINLCSLVLTPAWVQTFVMTFLAEWGDRSQIATIAMAAGDDYWYVIWGAVLGHGLCTGAAVLCGKAIAGRVSMRLVTLAGAGAFLVFSLIYLGEFLFT